MAWARSFHDALEPFSTGGVYVNFLSEEGTERVRAAYGPEKFARLSQGSRPSTTPTTCSG